MRADIVALARGWLGTPYHHQASLKGVGCDCLGLIRGVYAEACGQPAETPPPYSRDWAEASLRETMIEAASRYFTPIDPDAAEPGDVLIFRLRPRAMAKHCAIVTCAPGIRPAVGPLAGEFLLGGSRLRPGLGPACGLVVCLEPGIRPARGPACGPRETASNAVAAACLESGFGTRGPQAGQRPERRRGPQAKMIHAIEGAPACEVHITPWWRRRIAAAFRFPD
jgi:NlpC/P60 family putative phage cell wall peptidase